MDNLPADLRDSRLPWAPDLETQSPAPGPYDSWHALVGTLEWSINAHLDHPGDPLSFLLGLRDLAADEETQQIFQVCSSLHDAVVASEAVHSLLLLQLQQNISSPKELGS